MAYRAKPRLWPAYLRKCLCCHGPAKGRTYGARGLCFGCHQAAKRNGTHRQWEKSVPAASDNAVMAIVYHVGQTEAAACLGIDKSTLTTWARDGVPKKRLADVYETLAALNLQCLLGKINRRDAPLPYRTAEAAPTPFRDSALAEIL